jgi:hypothetical protein
MSSHGCRCILVELPLTTATWEWRGNFAFEHYLPPNGALVNAFSRGNAPREAAVQKSRLLLETQAPEITPLFFCRIYVRNGGPGARYSAAVSKRPGSCEAVTGCPSRRDQSSPPSNSLARNPSRASLYAPLVDALQPIPSQ